MPMRRGVAIVRDVVPTPAEVALDLESFQQAPVVGQALAAVPRNT